ncbi:hypothetical protein BDK51DRAFT_52389 [Blyttiomyces helicus]|uniref:Uncharacterized protein n=1 Tax=Blyttiomyces helicus TaxID=388810 RepID=A0A4P9W4L7_9FUNG|nr:hypothetical protein BDK51DRAFT_52389 [Blyttiomyces helicus]|eukprot:RKO85808.1 hypothetical protein BDK51DRAFT_52389 [Blyttiomyces helicus]
MSARARPSFPGRSSSWIMLPSKPKDPLAWNQVAGNMGRGEVVRRQFHNPNDQYTNPWLPFEPKSFVVLRLPHQLTGIVEREPQPERRQHATGDRILGPLVLAAVFSDEAFDFVHEFLVDEVGPIEDGVGRVLGGRERSRGSKRKRSAHDAGEHNLESSAGSDLKEATNLAQREGSSGRRPKGISDWGWRCCKKKGSCRVEDSRRNLALKEFGGGSYHLHSGTATTVNRSRG